MKFDTRLEIRMEAGLRRELEVLAAARQWPLGVLVRELLRQAMDQQVADRPRRRKDVRVAS